MLNRQNIFKHPTFFGLLIVGFFMLYPVVFANGVCVDANCALGSMQITIPAGFNNSANIVLTVAGNNNNLQDSITLTVTTNQNAGNPTVAPTASILCNGNSSTCSIVSGNTATISWACGGGATTGSVSPGNWVGLSGAQNSGALTSAQTYTLTCAETGFTSATANAAVTIVGQTGATAGILCVPSSCSVPTATGIGFTNTSTP